MTSEPNSPTPSLYEWAGGEAAIRRLMDCFYDRVERDELLSPTLRYWRRAFRITDEVVSSY